MKEHEPKHFVFVFAEPDSFLLYLICRGGARGQIRPIAQSRRHLGSIGDAAANRRPCQIRVQNQTANVFPPAQLAAELASQMVAQLAVFTVDNALLAQALLRRAARRFVFARVLFLPFEDALVQLRSHLSYSYD